MALAWRPGRPWRLQTAARSAGLRSAGGLDCPASRRPSTRPPGRPAEASRPAARSPRKPRPFATNLSRVPRRLRRNLFNLGHISATPRPRTPLTCLRRNLLNLEHISATARPWKSRALRAEIWSTLHRFLRRPGGGRQLRPWVGGKTPWRVESAGRAASGVAGRGRVRQGATGQRPGAATRSWAAVARRPRASQPDAAQTRGLRRDPHAAPAKGAAVAGDRGG